VTCPRYEVTCPRYEVNERFAMISTADDDPFLYTTQSQSDGDNEPIGGNNAKKIAGRGENWEMAAKTNDIHQGH